MVVKVKSGRRGGAGGNPMVVKVKDGRGGAIVVSSVRRRVPWWGDNRL